MRKIHKVIIHCSDSDRNEHDNIESIRGWHVDRNGWSDIGYHFFIDKAGAVHKGRPVTKVGAHCLGENSDSIGICLSGKETFTPSQFFNLAWLVNDLIHNYEEIKEVKPHSYYNKKKTCPNFDLSIFHLQQE